MIHRNPGPGAEPVVFHAEAPVLLILSGPCRDRGNGLHDTRAMTAGAPAACHVTGRVTCKMHLFAAQGGGQ